MTTISQAFIHRMAIIGNYLPRKCGIATFTTDLYKSITAQYPDVECMVMAMNDDEAGYDYPPQVRFELQQEDLKSYQRAAEFLNLQNIDLVSLQHEFGIFGGKAGSHILTILRGLHVPVVTTLHTILTDPDPDQQLVMNELTELSDRLVVMSQRAGLYLEEIYHVPAKKIAIIPHGIPDVPFLESSYYKDKFNIEGKQVILTFGLLSPNKGIEYVIRALPKIVEHYPDVVYFVLGTTHPNVKRMNGESYRDSLKNLAAELGVKQNVVFNEQFVSGEKLQEFIGAADIYITPYLNEAQIVSGTLAYTVGAGKPVISTPYWYAEEILADGRGIIVPFHDAEAIAEQVIYLLDNGAQRDAIRKRAYLFGREMIWANVARLYIENFDKVRHERVSDPKPASAHSRGNGPGSGESMIDPPALNLNHLVRMTDHRGMLQHATYNLPNYHEGYATDDNARALVLALLLDHLETNYYIDLDTLISRYLAFVWYAFNPETGRFRNFMSFEGHWLEDTGSEDSHGRSLWSLGSVIQHASDEGLKAVAVKLFGQAIPAVLDMRHPRAWAFSLLGINSYLNRYSGDRSVAQTGRILADRLLALYHSTSGPDWYWFEDTVTYNNATLPHALLLSSQWMERPDMAEAALESLHWLAEIQTSPKGYFRPVGADGFFPRTGAMARFDQQPIEASAMISACLEAYRLTSNNFWLRQTQTAFEWFLGRNDLGLSLYDPSTGGCHDGLQPDRLNQNQGAESTLAFLLALAEVNLSSWIAPYRRKHAHSLSRILTHNFRD